jgi:trehalose 6-phosphate synthase
LAHPEARSTDDPHASRETLTGPTRPARGSAQLVVVTDRPPMDPQTSRVAPGAGLPDDPALTALQAAAARSNGVWLHRPGEQSPTVPLRHREVAPAGADTHDAGHAAALWPLWHGLGPGRYDPAWRHAFRSVNATFADAVAQEAATGAAVWFHGHSLTLAPTLLRRRRPDLRIGLTLPAHLPGTDTFRTLPMHLELLEGMLGADLIGFSTATAGENFLRLVREVDEPVSSVGVFPPSVDTRAIAGMATAPGLPAAVAALRSRLGDPETVILCINPPDQSQGIEGRLLALGEAFRDGRLDPTTTVVIQIVLGRSDLVDGAARAAAHVNGQHATIGRPCVHFVVDTPSLAERVTLYHAADVLLATPLREGTTTPALEFAAAGRFDAALVLSSLSGTATVLPDAHLVNPHDDEAVQAGLVAALTSSVMQRRERMQRMRAYVAGYHTFTWAEQFLRTLRAVPRRTAIVGPGQQTIRQNSTQRGTSQERGAGGSIDGARGRVQFEPAQQ